MNLKHRLDIDESSTPGKIFYADLRGIILALERSGRSWKEIGASTYLGASTVQRFAERTTIRPSTFTVNQLAKYAGYRVALIPIATERLPGEID